MSDITEAQVKNWLEAKRIEFELVSLDLVARDYSSPRFSATAGTGEIELLVDSLSSIKSWALENNKDAAIRGKIADHERKAAELKKSIGEGDGDEG